jgi:hypothetical protein
MGEIKSSVELAMERSRRFSLTEEEREEIKRKEIEEKASRLFHRYREGHLPLHEMEREMEKMDEPYREKVKGALLKLSIDALTLGEDYERLLSGIEWLKGSSLDAIRRRLHELTSSFSEERKKVEQEVKKAMMEELKRMGFSGSAIELHVGENPEADRLWAARERTYQEQVRQIQEMLRNL